MKGLKGVSRARIEGANACGPKGFRDGAGRTACLWILMMISLPSILIPLATAGAAAADIVWDGDKTVSGDETFKGKSILMQGKLTITGSLTLVGVDLWVEYTPDGANLILVEDGGSLTVLASSEIHSTDPEVHYAFQVRRTGTLVMNDSEVHDCGYEDQDNGYANVRGLYLESSNVIITNCSFTQNAVGIFVDGGSSPYIAGNDVCKNDETGILVKGASSPMICGNTISNNLQNLPLYEGGGINSESASPTIENNTISSNIDSYWGLVFGIFATNGPLVITNNTITGHIDPYGYSGGWGIAVYFCSATITRNTITGNDNGIDIVMGSCVLEDNLVGDTGSNGGIGLYDNGGSVSHNNTYRGNVYGVMVGDNSASVFDNDTFEDNEQGLDGDAGAVPFDDTLTDCVFIDNDRDVALTAPWNMRAGGTVTLVRPRYDPAKVSVTDGSSMLIVKWDLRVRLVFESNGRAASGSSVEVFDASGMKGAAASTGADGWTDTMQLEEYRLIGKFRQSKSPYDVTGRSGSYNASVNKLKLNASQELTIVLDDVLPDIEILAPANGTLTNSTGINVVGRCEPGAHLKVDGRTVAIEPDGNWSVAVDLPVEGENDIVLEAQDAMQNTARRSLKVIRDTIVPAVLLDSPADNFLVNTTTIRVAGAVTEPLASLTVNGETVFPDEDGKFSVVVNLTEGKNTLELACIDAAGNSGALVRSGSRDTEAPFLRIVEPADGARTNASLMKVVGQIEAGAALTMNGQPYPVAETGFSNYLELSEGENLFAFVARDRAGNLNTTVVRVLRDATPPAISIDSPADGTRLNKTTVVVSGTTEAGAAVRVNGRAVAAPNGSFIAEVSLKEGDNCIAVESTDVLGNIGSRSIAVVVDTVGPDLRILGPANRTLTNQSTVEVSGMTEPGAVVVVDGQKVAANPQGRFSVMVGLDTEGANHIPVSSWDALYNIVERNITVYRDTQARLNLTSPLNGAKVKGGNVTVTGMAEPNSTIWISGMEVRQAADGSFSASVPLVNGLNTVMVLVRDAAGNTGSVELTVTRMAPSDGEAQGGAAIIGASILMLAVAGIAVGIYLRRRA